jgi:hypothetical protein
MRSSSSAVHVLMVGPLDPLHEESNTSAPAIPHRTSPDPDGTVKTSIS